MINRIKYAIVGLFFLGNFSLAFAVPPEVTRFTLSNGIKVVNLYVEDSHGCRNFQLFAPRTCC